MTDKTKKPARKTDKHWAEMLGKAETPAQRLAWISFYMDALADPEEALHAHATGRTYTQWTEKHFMELVQEAARVTGADPAEIADKDRRTPEQQKALLEASAREQLARMDVYLKSNFMQAASAILDDDKIEDVTGLDDKSHKEKFAKITATYFFALHDSINPAEPASLTPEGLDEVRAIYIRLIRYFEEHGGAAIETLKAFIEQDAPATAKDILPRLLSVFPEKHIIPNTKLSNTLTKDIIDAGTVAITVSKAGAPEPVDTTCILTYESENVKLSGRQKFTEFDRNVYNAVTSLYVYGGDQHIVTPAMVYRAMVGLRRNEKPTQQQLEAVTTSLDKMRFIRAQIDCTAELAMRKLTINGEQIKCGMIDTYLLTAEAIKVSAGGNAVTAYHIIKTPVLYEYAAAVKHVLTVPAEMLDIKLVDKKGKPTTRSLAYTEQRVKIKGYLLRRIEGMRNNKNALKNNSIAFLDYSKGHEEHPGLYTIAGKTEPTKDDARYIRVDAEAMLKYWTAAGYIKGYAAYKKGKALAGFTVDV